MEKPLQHRKSLDAIRANHLARIDPVFDVVKRGAGEIKRRYRHSLHQRGTPADRLLTIVFGLR
ncbi:hypothetical protein R69888_02603 [Paraburkholderia haematera]|uniref:Transposase n=1 Tax=Paraburkholderia haematera TaxID=2793077 RepID=A0ABM8RAU8_9BURK|nr:hypothetical protein R69888_02603 [Paraburkholderia haematera]